MPDKRYQVFVSSTYEDLKAERQEVMQALLALNCIPSGMELFPAADETQWDLIKRVIDDCDYYILIVAGRYGSLGPTGISYTEMEYDYAIQAGKPTLAFVHSEPDKLASGMCEKNDAGKEKLQLFREKLKGKHYKRWSHPKDLKGEVAVSIGNLINTKPATGWVRSSEVIGSEAAIEINRLRDKIDDLTQKLDMARTTAPAGTDNLSQGDETISLKFEFRNNNYDDYSDTTLVSWNTLFRACGPNMLQEASDSVLQSALNQWLETHLKTDKAHAKQGIKRASLLKESFDQIKIQFIALGLVQKSDKPRSITNSGTYWSLTPYGELVLTNLLAVKRS